MALRNEIVAAVAFVLRLRCDRRLQRQLGLREEADARLLAERIVRHLELCRIRFAREPPGPSHRTPDPGRRDGGPP